MHSPWVVTLGTDDQGAPVEHDLSAAPHLLLAGTTGSGKSQSMHALIAGLVQAGSPDDTTIIICDPKMIDFPIWAPAPHVAAVHVDRDAIARAIADAAQDMMSRYARMTAEGVIDCRDLRKPLPRVFLFVDELADLLLTDKTQASRLRAAAVLGSLTRIAQLGRAAGYHLVAGTQTPRADVLPGCLRANIPTRWIHRVGTRQESTTAMDMRGAESLGQAPGTSLLRWRSAQVPVFVQARYVSRTDITAIVAASRATYGSGRRTGAPSVSGGKGIERLAGLHPVAQVAVGVAFTVWCGYVALMSGK